jgi:CRISPR-associated protein Cmr2
MKKIIDGILKEDKDNKSNIIIPCAENYPELKAVGLYPDRLLYKGTLEDINSVITDAINDLSALIGIKNSFLKEYLQVYYFSSDKIENVCGKNYVEKLNLVLDSLELERKITSSNNIKTISNFFKKLPNTKLYQDHFEKEYEKKVKSLVEISTAGLSGFEEYDNLVKQYIKAEVENDDSKFLEDLQRRIKEKKDTSFTFHNYHKYVAVISADGDKMGEMIGKIVRNNDLTLIHKVSNILFEWAKEAADKIKDFGGLPIYAGGDDLLCFTPIANEGKNIIEILKEISNIFTKKFENSIKEKDLGENPEFPTLSFGVSIAYYKYPLNESLEMAHELLRKMKDRDGNGICMRMLKHSGSDFDFVLNFNSKSFSIFNSLMDIELTETMLSSTAYHLQDNVKVMDEIADQPDRVKQFFINKMDGYPKNAGENTEHYLLEVEKLINIAFKEKMKDEKGNYINRMLPVYDMLRLVKFFKGLNNAS